MWTPEKISNALSDIHYQAFFTKTEVKSLHTILQADERLIWAVEGTLKRMHNRVLTGNGMAVLTDRRVIFYRKSVINTVTCENIPIGQITSSSYRKAILGGSLMIYAASNLAEIQTNDKAATEAMAQKIQNLIAIKATPMPTVIVTQRTAPPSPSLPATADVATQLEKLFSLKEKGAISEDEYQEQKRKLLR